MSRKDYQLIADVLKKQRQFPDQGPLSARDHIDVCIDFANALGRDSPNFDRGRFLAAAGASA